MATDTAPPVNGMYGSQYGSPAELPAPTPGASHAPSASQSITTSTTAAAKADPQEIGWYFVEQYYTTLSKNPERIHLFYSKKSQLVIGVEAEKVVPAVGTKAISDKIKELDIQDCKVRVLNVDSQASFQNIVVQVIGEMSNKSEPHHRFVQTFVLAEQPNGYFVLNDIFRYLNDDEDEIIEDEPAQENTAITQDENMPTIAPEVEAEKTEDVSDQAAAQEVDAKLEEVAKSEDELSQDPSLTSLDQEVQPAPAAEDLGESTKEEADNGAAVIAESATTPIPAEKPSGPGPTPAQSPPKSTQTTPAVEAPPQKMTWARAVGTKAAPTPVAPVSSAPTAPAPSRAQRTPQTPAPQPTLTDPLVSPMGQGNGWQTADHSKKQSRTQPKVGAEQNTLAYIKNVNDKIQASDLRVVLEKYGELKYFDVSRPRNCAFVEFADAAGYNAAVAANPHNVGTEQIYVEERRPRPNAFGGSSASFSRGGTPPGRGRGGMQGRGNYQSRGGKSGNVTPKGRGA